MTVKKKLKVFFWFDRYNLSKKTFFHQNSSKKKLYHQKDYRKISLLLKYEVALMSTLAVIAVGKSLWQSFPSMILQSNPSLFLSHNGKLGRGSQSSSPSRREIILCLWEVVHIFFSQKVILSLLDDCDPLPNFPLWLRKRLGFDCKIIDGKDCQSEISNCNYCQSAHKCYLIL